MADTASGTRPKMVISDNGFLRRVRIDLFTPAERAIHDAVDAVELAAAHPLLTQAVIQLGYAQAAVADFVDMQIALRVTPPSSDGIET